MLGPLRLAAWECKRLVWSGAGLSVVIALGLAWWAQPQSGPWLQQQGAERGMRLSQTLWEWSSLLLFPALALHGGGLVSRWRAGEGDWLAPRIGLGSALLACAAGLFAGGALLASLPALAAWSAHQSPGDGSSSPAYQQLVHAHHETRAQTVGPSQTLQLVLPEHKLESGASARMRVLRGPGGARARDVRVVLVRGDASAEHTVTFAVPTWVEVPVPAGHGNLAVGLRNEGEGSVLVPSGASVQVFAPRSAEWQRALDPWQRCVRALAIVTALAIGFGAWMGAGTAAACALGLPLFAQVFFPQHHLLPWTDFGSALQLLGDGRLPSASGGLRSLAAAGWIAAGLGLARAGQRGWCAR